MYHTLSMNYVVFIMQKADNGINCLQSSELYSKKLNNQRCDKRYKFITLKAHFIVESAFMGGLAIVIDNCRNALWI